MGNVQMEASMIRYGSGTVKSALDNGGGGGGASTLAALTDTAISNPSNGQLLTYDSSASKWKNANAPAVAASAVSFNGTASSMEATNVQGAIDELVVNFQAGVDDCYDACVAKGSTPASHSLSDVVTAIGNISGGGSGDILLYVIETKSSGGQDAALTVKKYLNGTLQSSTDYLYSDVSETPANIDNYFDLDYGITAIQSWTYKLKVASLLLHPVNYVKTWGYTLDVSEAENFSV